MGKSWMFCVLLAACKPMYGAAPASLRTPEPVKPPPITETEKPVIYDDYCELLTTRTPVVKRETKQAAPHIEAGDRKVADFDAAAGAKTDLIVDGIDEYARALRKDPFNAQATLKLALAYDKVRRKGCALALLKRLEQLAQNPKLAKEANEAIDEVEQRQKWFGGYRRDALRTVGR